MEKSSTAGNDLSSPWQRCYLTLNSAAYVAAVDDLCLTLIFTFLQISRNPNIDLKFVCIFGKTMKCTFQRCTVLMEILSTFYAQVENISVQQICH